MIVAFFGDKSINLVIAEVVLFFEIPSRYFPKLTRVKIIPAASKYKES